MNNQKWQVGPVKLADGSEGYIDFVQPESDHYRYLGRFKDVGGIWRTLQWSDCGRVPYTTSGYAKNLAPPPKKKLRVQFWVNVYPSSFGLHLNKQHADKEAGLGRLCCIEIDREVEEGEGLSCQ